MLAQGYDVLRQRVQIIWRNRVLIKLRHRSEPAADLGVAAAIASSFRNRPVPAHTAVFGEVGLGGEIRGVSQAALRVREAAQMGFTRCLLPARNVPAPVEGVELVGVETLSEALEKLLE